VLAGYERAFLKTMTGRLGDWRAVLKQVAGLFPNLGNQNLGPVPNARIRHIQQVLVFLLEAEHREDASHVAQRILFVRPCFSNICKKQY